MRGWRIGEASHPGPGGMYLYESEEGNEEIDLDALFDPAPVLELVGLAVPDSLTQRESDGGRTPPGTDNWRSACQHLVGKRA